MTTKICLVCKHEKELGLFPRDGARYRNVCFKCEGGVDDFVTPSTKRSTRSVKNETVAGNLESEVIIAIGDLHEPFTHPDALDFVEAAIAHYRPTKVVLLGDEIDAHALSDWMHDPNGMSPEAEHAKAVEHLHHWYNIIPEAYVCESNHTSRLYKKGFKNGIPERFFRDYAEILEAPPGWHWASQWEFDGVRYEHGEAFAGQTGAFKSALHNQQSTIIGHIHSHAGIQYLQSPSNLIYGFNVGCLIDETAYAFHYAKFMKSRPVIGIGVVDRGCPHFIPMRMDKKGRWTGKL